MKNTTAEVRNFLTEQFEKGNLWVSFKGRELPDSVDTMEAHLSATDAMKRCQGFSFQGNRIVDGKQEVAASYASIPNLLTEIKFEMTGALEAVADLATVRAGVEALGVRLVDSERQDLQIARLGLGDVVMAAKRISILPYEEIERYYLLVTERIPAPSDKDSVPTTKIIHEDEHISGVVGEYLRISGKDSPLVRADMLNVHIVGGFHGMELEFNHQGKILRNTGLTISIDQWHNGKNTPGSVLDCYSKIELEQLIYLRYSPQSGRVELRDDQLRLANPRKTFASYGSMDFIETNDSTVAVTARMSQLAMAMRSNRAIGEDPPSSNLKL